MHLAAYVARVLPLSGLKVETALISPTVPIEIRSSESRLGVLYFLAICATSRRLCSMSLQRASWSPSDSRTIYAFSSSGDSCGGKEFPPLT